ncbi:hypothetical protein SKAU_G00401250 [Synaphobranchus kaupii]|uniref:Uncharacterized protein n=1 Tax=Synaphobranchus kaupii TaxID=118154 RepID=A0A9Q1ICF0_SYNKA|nr:hypothetical protein SKAU_G00401250 [Synaphobranchus kaupii]
MRVDDRRRCSGGYAHVARPQLDLCSALTELELETSSNRPPNPSTGRRGLGTSATGQKQGPLPQIDDIQLLTLIKQPQPAHGVLGSTGDRRGEGQ